MSDHGFQIPHAPDWPWLRATWPGNILLHDGCDVASAARAVMGVGFLAMPYASEVTFGPGAFDRMKSFNLETRGARWQRAFALEGVATIAPAMTQAALVHADVEGWLDPLDAGFWRPFHWRVLGKADAVLVPPIPGWDAAPEVWQAATWALTRNKPVFLIAEGGA